MRSYTLESSLGWSTMMASYASTGLGMNMLLGMLGRNRKLEKAYRHLPLNEADRIITGRSTNLYQSVLEHGPEDDYWKPVDFSARVPEVTIPIYLMGGWYDLFLDWQLKDYQAFFTWTPCRVLCRDQQSLSQHRRQPSAAPLQELTA
jgi:uncharacterized protein